MLNKEDIYFIKQTELYEKSVKLELFGEGPWMDEPDFEKFKYNGLNCMLIRSDIGCWCGYVQLPENHPWIRIDYHEINDIDVHGGLSFKGPRTDYQEEGEWIGFDCAHSMDLSPSNEKVIKEIIKHLYRKFPGIDQSLLNPTYKDINFVREETKRLADQVKSAK